MRYDNSHLRRQDRLLKEKEALELLSNGEYGILSLVSEEMEGYGIPLNYVWDGKENIYFHCAPEGKKIDIIKKNPKASFCIVGNTQILSNKFTTNYQSLILSGSISLDLSPEEKMQGLELLLQKYSPNDLDVGKQYIKNAIEKTSVLKMHVTGFSGKCNNRK